VLCLLHARRDQCRLVAPIIILDQSVCLPNWHPEANHIPHRFRRDIDEGNLATERGGGVLPSQRELAPADP